MYKYNDFIPQNVVSPPWRRFVVKNSKGNKIGQIALDGLAMPKTGAKLFSFLLLSDVHVVYETAAEDFQRALTYASNNTDILFTAIAGDLTDNGSQSELTQYKNIVDAYSGGKPVYACAGNHEHYASTSSAYLEQYTGHPLCYSFEQGDHVFLMVGVSSGTVGEIFKNGQLQWLYEQLEANRNKHCWVFQHILTPEGSGDALGIYPWAKLTGTEGTVFKSLLRHYKNVIFVHGHSHMMFSMQEYGKMANYDNVFGVHSIHVPSCAVPRNVDETGLTYETYYAGSEGYVVTVYENGIHLRGRDFVNGEFLPIASYWNDTTLQEVPAGTYTDSTGTITT